MLNGSSGRVEAMAMALALALALVFPYLLFCYKVLHWSLQCTLFDPVTTTCCLFL